jgi:hypothetical protein
MQKSCGEVYAIATYNYINDNMLWDIQIPQNYNNYNDYTNTDDYSADPSCH